MSRHKKSNTFKEKNFNNRSNLIMKDPIVAKKKKWKIKNEKIIEYNETLFTKVFFSNSNIYGKIMFTVDN